MISSIFIIQTVAMNVLMCMVVDLESVFLNVKPEINALSPDEHHHFYYVYVS